MNPNVIAILVILTIPLNLLVTVMLFVKSRKDPDISVLRERFVVSVAVLLAVLVFGPIFINNDTIPPPFDTDATKLVTRLAILLLATVPALYWLFLYRNGD